jgi:hypothetical protein
MASRARTSAQNEMAPTILRVSGRREGWSSGSMERMQVQRARGQDNRQKKTTAHKIVYIRIFKKLKKVVTNRPEKVWSA